MSLYAFCCLLRSRWQGLAGALWPDTLQEQRQSQLALVDGELQRRQRQLIKYNQKTEKLRNLLHRSKNRLQALACQDMDGRRIEKLERLRQRLRDREQQYRELLAQFERWKERKAVRDRLIRPLAAENVRVEEEESDSGYPF
jgi:hypothetical protein